MGRGRWCELILFSKETLWWQGGPSREIFPFLDPVVQHSFNSTTCLQWQNSKHWLWLSCAGSRQYPALLRTNSSGNSHHQRREKGVGIQLVGVGPVVWHPTSLASDYVDGVFNGSISFFYFLGLKSWNAPMKGRFSMCKFKEKMWVETTKCCSDAAQLKVTVSRHSSATPLWLKMFSRQMQINANFSFSRNLLLHGIQFFFFHL